MDKIKVCQIAENNGDSEIYKIFYEDEENGHLYFAMPPATTSYSQISPMQALRSSKFTVTKKNAKLMMKFNVSNEKKLLEFVQMRRGGDNANWDNVKLFMLFWLLMVKEKLTWKKLAFSLQSGSCAQKSSWSEILGAPPEEYMVEGLTP